MVHYSGFISNLQLGGTTGISIQWFCALGSRHPLGDNMQPCILVMSTWLHRATPGWGYPTSGWLRELNSSINFFGWFKRVNFRTPPQIHIDSRSFFGSTPSCWWSTAQPETSRPSSCASCSPSARTSDRWWVAHRRVCPVTASSWDLGVAINWESPTAGWFMMENPNL